MLPNGPSVSKAKVVVKALSDHLVHAQSPVTRKVTVLSGGQNEAACSWKEVKMDWAITSDL